MRFGKGKICINHFHYVLIRKDLPKGFQAAQIVHAAGESVRKPLPNNTHAIVLEVEDEASLRAWSQRLGVIEHVLIEEVDAPFSGQATAIGICPVPDRCEIKRLCSSLPLLK